MKNTAPTYIYWFIVLIPLIFISCGNGGKTVTIEQGENNDSNIIKVDMSEIENQTINNYINQPDKIKNRNLVGKWKSSEIWTKLIFNYSVYSEIEFQTDRKFNCKAKFNTGGFDHFVISYNGAWSIEDNLLLLSDVKIDSLKNFEQAGGNKSLSLMMAQNYLAPNRSTKIEEIQAFTKSIVKTEWKIENSQVEKLYERKRN